MTNLFGCALQAQALFRRAMNKLYPYVFRRLPGLTLGRNVRFIGMPIIDVRNGGKIHIGDDTQIMSYSRSSHVNYCGPAKLMAALPGAEISIGSGCTINGACINAYGRIGLGDRTIIGPNSNLFDANGHPVHLDRHEHRRFHLKDHEPITIGRNVWIALNCVVLPGTTIGDGTIVAANSVVRGCIPEYRIVSGNPAVAVARVRRGMEGLV